MTDSGLTSRLRQQSRRTGFAVGAAMALTIALCIGGFVVIYAQVDPLTRDFIAAPATPTPTAEPRESGSSSGGNEEQSNNSASNDETEEEPEGDNPEPTPTPEETAAPTATPEEFEATHLSNTETAVNFRAGPSTDMDIVGQLFAGTPLRATGEEGTDSDGLVWLEFETEDGTVGWIREIDSEPQS